MVHFCKYCKETHDENDLCPFVKKELKNNPQLLSEAANFINVAGQDRLVSSQDIGNVIKNVNKLAGSNLRVMEGSHQAARDIQVFKRLHEEAYRRLGIFSSPEMAKQYFEKATGGQLGQLSRNLSGSGQEVDWFLQKKGGPSNIFQKNVLLTNNAEGVDGITVNRFTGDTISRTTIKAAQYKDSISTNIDGIIKSLKKGTLKPGEIAVGVDGTKDALLGRLKDEIEDAVNIGNKEHVAILTEAKENLIIKDFNTTEHVKESVDRLKGKIQAGQASTVVTLEHAARQMAQGAIIGAAIGLTISSLTNYIRYRKGELTIQETFTAIGEDTVKSTLIGSAMAGIVLFLPAGPIGFIAGFAIGIYFNAVLTNALDEIFGKGLYCEILIASGHIMGTSANLLEALKTFKEDRIEVSNSINSALDNIAETESILAILEARKGDDL